MSDDEKKDVLKNGGTAPEDAGAPAKDGQPEKKADEARRSQRRVLNLGTRRRLFSPVPAAPGDKPKDKEAGEEPKEARAHAQNAEVDTAKLPRLLPLVPLRDLVLFNSLIMPLFVTREQSVAAMSASVDGPHYVLCVTQKDDSTEKPSPDDLYDTGVVVQVLRLLKMPDNKVKALIQAVARARVHNVDTTGPFMTAEAEYIDEPEAEVTTEVEAMMREVRELSEKVLSLRGIPTSELMAILGNIDKPGKLADLVAGNLRMSTEEAQKLLEVLDPVERLRGVIKKLEYEVAVASMQMRIRSSARDGMEKAQKEYFLREQMKAIRQELGDKGDDADDDLQKLRKALAKAGLPAEVKKEAEKQMRRLSVMHADASEAAILHTYLEFLSELPWKKVSKDNLDIANAKAILDEDHYGLDKIKDRILEFLSVHKLNPKTHGSILCFVGPPGVGKTSLGKSIARALGRKFERLSLGGMHDEAEIRGHRRTYIGAMPGRILQALKHAGTRNPVIVLDELDKVGNDFRGDPQSALLEVLDPEQNSTFSDHYLNVPFDLSKVMFLCTANQLDTIPPALRDRMEIIRLSGYTMQEKEKIAATHLVGKRLADNGLKAGEVKLTAKAIQTLITGYTREAGVRELERQIGAVCRKLARKKAEGEKPPFKVDAPDVAALLGHARFIKDDKSDTLLPGMAYGLAWTSAGGEVLTIEATVFKGTGKVQLTGSLGDVMKESAQAAISYIRAHADEFGVKDDFHSKCDIHVHVPDGATPKDGPSAGVTLITAILSALTGKPVCSDLCMTGETDIKGRVLPVGGIKEKLLGGMAFNLKRVCIPKANEKDLEDIPADMLKKFQVSLVSDYMDIYKLAFKKTAPRRTKSGTQAAKAGEKGTTAARTAPKKAEGTKGKSSASRQDAPAADQQ